jgi:kynurenine formamidase
LSEIFETTEPEMIVERFGHFGTHLDSLDKEFPLDYCERNGVIFDVSSVRGRDISIEDVDIVKIAERDFVLFHTGYLKEKGYRTPEYQNDHPQLSNELIQYLVDKKISLMGIDMRGVRKPPEHFKADHYCSGRGIFIIENLNNLDKLLKESADKKFIVHTYPILIKGTSGHPSRVIAEIE